MSSGPRKLPDRVVSVSPVKEGKRAGQWRVIFVQQGKRRDIWRSTEEGARQYAAMKGSELARGVAAAAVAGPDVGLDVPADMATPDGYDRVLWHYARAVARDPGNEALQRALKALAMGFDSARKGWVTKKELAEDAQSVKEIPTDELIGMRNLVMDELAQRGVK